MPDDKPHYEISSDGAVSTTAAQVLNSKRGKGQLAAVRQMREAKEAKMPDDLLERLQFAVVETDDPMELWKRCLNALHRIKARDAEIARLRKGLKFYADGNHYAWYDQDEWDTVSGEPQNWWEHETAGMIEDGSVAQAVLDGRDVGTLDEKT